MLIGQKPFTYTCLSSINMPLNFSMAKFAAFSISKCTNPYHFILLRNHGHQDYKEIGKTKQVILLIGGCNFHIEVGTYLSNYNILNNGCITTIYHNRNITFYLQTNCKC